MMFMSTLPYVCNMIKLQYTRPLNFFINDLRTKRQWQNAIAQNPNTKHACPNPTTPTPKTHKSAACFVCGIQTRYLYKHIPLTEHIYAIRTSWIGAQQILNCATQGEEISLHMLFVGAKSHDITHLHIELCAQISFDDSERTCSRMMSMF